MNKQRIEFFTPRYDGDRFAEHRLPIDLVEDLPVLKEMTVEMAKFLYRQKNPERERIPKNFTSGISFELESLGEGSTIPKIVLICQPSGMFPNPSVEYFKEAKEQIINVIQAAEDDADINSFAPNNVLRHFSKFGRKLAVDEYIDFTPELEKKARFTKESRKKIIQASSSTKEYTDDITLRGHISELDLKNKTFHIELINGKRLITQYPEESEDILTKALSTFNKPSKQKILLESSVRFSRTDSILKIEETKNIIDLDFNDIPFRLEEIANLKRGWFNGFGKEFDSIKLDELANSFENKFNGELPLPSVYPTPDNNIQFEWDLGDFDVSLLVNLNDDFDGEIHILNHKSDEDSSKALKLNSEGGWNDLNKQIENLIG